MKVLVPGALVTLTTDFGAQDWFVGTMKGVILGLNPQATVVDISHEIPVGDIRAAAFALRASYRFFPKGSIHVVVVDPGVGSERAAIAVRTADYTFVGPDNGVLSWALARESIRGIRLLEEEKYFLGPVSRTFHGRDIFAPVAAHLSRGLPLDKLGPAMKDFIRLPWPEPTKLRSAVEGEVVYVDHFGNAITNLEPAALRGQGRGPLRVRLGRRRSVPVAEFYQAVPKGQAVAVFGSTGFLEIAVNGGSAARRFSLRVGARLSVASV